MRIRPYFRWFDLWIGVYVDTKTPALYIGYLPMLGLKVTWTYAYEDCPGTGKPGTLAPNNGIVCRTCRASLWRVPEWHTPAEVVPLHLRRVVVR